MVTKPFVQRRETGATVRIVQNKPVASLSSGERRAAAPTRQYKNMTLVKTEFEQFKKDGKADDLKTISYVRVLHGSETLKVPVMIWINREEAEWVRGNLKDLAEKGVVVAVSSPLYAFLKGQDIAKARAAIKPMTAHNDKLGFDYDLTSRTYIAKQSQQFTGSSYPGFL